MKKIKIIILPVQNPYSQIRRFVRFCRYGYSKPATYFYFYDFIYLFLKKVKKSMKKIKNMKSFKIFFKKVKKSEKK